MVEFFIGTFSDLTGSFGCYLEQLFCGEQGSPRFGRNDSTGNFISGVLKTRWAVLLAGLYNNKLKRNSIGDHFLEFFCKFQRTFNKFCKDFVFSNAVNC